MERCATGTTIERPELAYCLVQLVGHRFRCSHHNGSTEWEESKKWKTVPGRLDHDIRPHTAMDKNGPHTLCADIRYEQRPDRRL